MLVKVEGGINKFVAGVDMPKRFDQPPVDRDCLVCAEGDRRFLEHDIEPFLHHLIAQTSTARFVGSCDPFLRHGLFDRLGGINRINQQVGV